MSGNEEVIGANGLACRLKFAADAPIVCIGRNVQCKNVNFAQDIFDLSEQFRRAFLGTAVSQLSCNDDACA